METELPPERPGMLTFLAVVNFILGGLSVIGACFAAISPMLIGAIPAENRAQMTAEELAQIDALAQAGSGLVLVSAAMALVAGILLIVSGVGFLKMKKFLGWTLGNAYVVVSIVSSLASYFMLPEALGGGQFGIGAIIGLVYPVLILVFLNVVYKKNFVN